MPIYAGRAFRSKLPARSRLRSRFQIAYRSGMTTPGNTMEQTWTYWPAGTSRAIEFSAVRGCNVGLPSHFHNEDQFTFVHVGQRRFCVDQSLTTVVAGTGMLIPATTVHRSLPEPNGTIALNVYVPAGEYKLDGLWRDLARHCGNGHALAAEECAAIIESHRSSTKPRLLASPTGTFSQAALGKLTSREGFSRAFSRIVGMPPHAHARALRLNHARALLREGESIAAAAVEGGFVDQSHFGRLFRKQFGVTPGRYKRDWSQPYQTDR